MHGDERRQHVHVSDGASWRSRDEETRQGSILDIASVRGYECQRGVPACSASKGAIYNVDGGLLPGIGVQ